MTLDDYLGRYYRAAVLTVEATSPVVDGLKKALADDPALAAQARARLSEVREIDEQRCFVSKQHRDCLSAALGAS